MRIDTSKWERVGESANSDYYLIEPGVLAAVPRPGSIDDEASARDNLRVQLGYFKEHGPGVVVVFVDNMTSQDKDARRVYQADSDTDWMLGTALVGGRLLARAIGSFFLGLAKPRLPVKMFASLDEALAWAHELRELRASRSGTGGA